MLERRHIKARLAQIEEILFREWDPIGVNEYAQCRDEYDSYAPGLYRLLAEGADEDRLTRHLDRLATEIMGLSYTHDARHREVARRLLTLVEPDP